MVKKTQSGQIYADGPATHVPLKSFPQVQTRKTNTARLTVHHHPEIVGTVRSETWGQCVTMVVLSLKVSNTYNGVM